jgi:hypothetical protein
MSGQRARCRILFFTRFSRVLGGGQSWPSERRIFMRSTIRAKAKTGSKAESLRIITRGEILPDGNGIGRVLGRTPIGFGQRTKRLLGTATLALPMAWIALGWADHAHVAVLIWLFSPGLPLALHVPVPAAGFLDGVAKGGMVALLIDFAYYAALIFAGLKWISRHT